MNILFDLFVNNFCVSMQSNSEYFYFILYSHGLLSSMSSVWSLIVFLPLECYKIATQRNKIEEEKETKFATKIYYS